MDGNRYGVLRHLGIWYLFTRLTGAKKNAEQEIHR